MTEEKIMTGDGTDRLRGWALTHGSELLRARLADDYSWHRLAHEEFVAAHMPSGFERKIEARMYAQLEPSLAEITACREAQQLVASRPEIYASADLVCSTTIRQYIDSETDEYGENEGHVISATLVRLVIACPDGHRARVYKKI